MAEKNVYYHVTEDRSRPANPPPYAGPPSETYPRDPPAPSQSSQSTNVVQVSMAPATAPVPAATAPLIMPQPMGPKTTRTTCKFCNIDILTRVESDATSKTHLWAVCLFIFGFWCCCCIPYCMDSCMNINHYCPNCRAYLGTYISH